MKYQLPSSVTTVTGFSKLLALGLFVALPFIGYILGSLRTNAIYNESQISMPVVTQPIFIRESAQKTVTINESQKEVITGKVIINYKLREFPEVEDQVDVNIFDPNGGSPFGIAMCVDDKVDNCNKLISSKANQRIYQYRLTRDGGANPLMIGRIYTLSVNTAHWSYGDVTNPPEESGYPVGFGSADTVSVLIPENGIGEQDFIVTINPIE